VIGPPIVIDGTLRQDFQPERPSSQGPSSVSNRECSAEAGIPQAGSFSTAIHRP
jgi:hypothetical protein